MTVEQRPAGAIPHWLKVTLGVVSAIAVFRVCTVILGLVLWLFQGAFFPLFLREFLYRWDILIAPGVAVAAAVLSARWIESKLVRRRLSTVRLATLAFAALALWPVTVRFEAKPVMASPLLIAMHNNYSLDTIEGILNRYPHLANASDDDWGRTQPLVDAALERRTNLVELLIRKGARVDPAVQKLMQLDAEDAVRLVLKTAENHNQKGASVRITPGRPETNQTPSIDGAGR